MGGHQLHQHQQDEHLSSQISALAWSGMCDGVKLINGIQTPS